MSLVYFFKFPLEASLGGAEFHTLKLAQDLRKRGQSVGLITSDSKLFRLFEKNHLPRRRVFAGWEPTAKWSLLLWPLTYLIARIKFKKLLNQIPAKGIFYMQSLIEKLVLTPMLSTPSPVVVRLRRTLRGFASSPPFGTLPRPGEGKRYGQSQGGEKVEVIWIEHKIPGRWLTANPLKFRYLSLARNVEIITVSNFAKQEFVKLGVPEKNIQLVYPTPSPVVVRLRRTLRGSASSPPISRYETGGEREKGFTIGILSRLNPEKGVLDFVKLIIPQLKNRPAWKMLIAGEGPQGNDLESIIYDNDLEKQIKLLGFISDLDWFYSQISVLVYPTKVPEAFGISALEAMTRDVPVIASNLGALPEIVKSEKNGFLVEPQNPNQWVKYLERLS